VQPARLRMQLPIQIVEGVAESGPHASTVVLV
jgi:hypothetical protein